MLGHAKYAYGDIVDFVMNDVVKEGVVAIIDAYGTFEQHIEASYDIMIQKENTLYKHIPESCITCKTGHTDLDPFDP